MPVERRTISVWVALGSCAGLVALALVGETVSAATIYKLTFDSDGASGGNANTPYTLGAGDVSPEVIDRLDGDGGVTVPQIADGSALQGGTALALTVPATGNLGYQARSTSGLFTIADGGGVTWEAVFYANAFVANSMAGLITQFGAGGISPTIRLDGPSGNNPHIRFAISQTGASLTYTPSSSLVGAWHHLACVYTKNADAGNSKLEMFLDGVAVTNVLYPTDSNQTFVKGAYAFGVDAPNVATRRVLDGRLDAVAISSDVLTPSTFLLATPLLYRLTFDNDGAAGGPANNPYTPAAGDVSPETIDRLDGGPTIPQLAVSTGPQGGEALALSVPASGNAGYLARNTSGAVTIPDGGGATWEVVFCPTSFAANAIAGLVSQTGAGGLAPVIRLQGAVANNPQIAFSLAQPGASLSYAPPTTLVGAWHHVAGVYTKDAGGGNSRIELFLDGASATSVVYATDANQTLVNGGYAFGVDAPGSTTGRVLSGRLDALTITRSALTPATFLLNNKVSRQAVAFDRCALTDPAMLPSVVAAGHLAGTNGWAVTGWFDYDFAVFVSGWYQLLVQPSSVGVEYFIDPALYAQGTGGAAIYNAGGGYNGSNDKIANVWLDAGPHTLRIQRYIWTGFPAVTGFQIVPPDSNNALAGTVRVAPTSKHLIFRKGLESLDLDVFSGGQTQAGTLNVWINNATNGSLVNSYSVPIPVASNLVKQHLTVPCDTAGLFTVSFGSGGQPIGTRDLRNISIEVVDTALQARPGGELSRVLVQTIDCTVTPPDYVNTGGVTRVVTNAAGAYRESGDVGYQEDVAHASWFAYTLSGLTTQALHQVEIDYPDDAVRCYLLSLRESAPADYPVAGGVDSGAEFALSRTMLTHSLFYWPRATGTRLVAINVHNGMRAAMARIRVYRVTGALPAMATPVGGVRHFASWYEEGANFTSMYGLDNGTAGDLRLAISRWLEETAYLGYNTLAPTVVVYGGVLYPSDQYNRPFTTPGSDETLRRILVACEARGMTCLPEIHVRPDELAWPYVSAADPKPNRLVSNSGQTESYSSHHYNPLWPSNQDWYVNMIGEMVDLHADSPALLGVNLRFMEWVNPTLNNFFSLEWGYDDYTVQLYKTETGSAVPFTAGDTNSARFSDRYAWLIAHEYTNWVSWRCDKIVRLYERISDRVRQARPDLKVYTSVFGLEATPPAPYLVSAQFREAGLDLQALATLPTNVVLINATHGYGRRVSDGTGMDVLFNQEQRDNLIDPAALNAMRGPGTNGYYLAGDNYFEMTDAYVTPEELGFPAGTRRTWTSAVVNPAGRHCLERYAVPLAECDAAWLSDGGNAYTLGQPLEREFMQEYGCLPPEPFAPRPDARDPVAVWTLTRTNEFLFYAVNRERFAVSVDVTLANLGQVYRLSTGTQVVPSNGVLRVALQPYQLLAYRASSGVSVAAVTTAIPADALAKVTAQVQWLSAVNAAVIGGALPNTLTAAQRQVLQNAANVAQGALSSQAVWRARTILEHHDLLNIYDSLHVSPPGLRDTGGGLLYRLTFDGDGMPGGDACGPYVLAAGDLSPEIIDRLDGADGTVPQIAASAGFEGGKALALTVPAAGNAGYRARNTQGASAIADGGGATWEVVFYVNAFAAGSIAGLIGNDGAGGLQPVLRLQGGSAGHPQVWFGIAQSGASLTFTPPSPLLGAWHHLAAVYTRTAGAGASKLELFLNGSSVTSVVYAASSNQTLASGGYTFGVDAPGSATRRVLDGKLDAVAISSAALAPGSFALGSPLVYRLTFDNDGIGGGSASNPYALAAADVSPEIIDRLDGDGGATVPRIVASTGYQGGRAVALSVPASGNVGYIARRTNGGYITIPDGGGITCEAVFYANSFTANSMAGLLGQFGTGGLDPGIRLQGTTANAPQILFGLAQTGATIMYTPTNSLIGAWHHVAAVYSKGACGEDSRMDLYLDGTRVTNVTFAVSSRQRFTLGYFYFGADAANVATRRVLNGTLDAIAISKCVLPPERFILKPYGTSAPAYKGAMCGFY